MAGRDFVSVKKTGPVEVPNVGRFQEQLLVLGAKWARWMDQYPVLSFGVESQVWYYDGGRVYLQVSDGVADSWNGLAELAKPEAEPLHSPSWYAYNILSQYEDYVLMQPTPPGFGPAYRAFAYGPMMGWWRSGGQKHLDAVNYLANNISNITLDLRYWRKHNEPPGCNWAPWSIRECSYGADAMLCQLATSGEKHPLLDDCIYDCVIEDLNEFMTPGSQTYLGTNGGRDPAQMKYVNNFMLGLALDTLIHYYEQTGASDIPAKIKQVLDFWWEFCVEKEDPFDQAPSFAQYYNSDLVNGKDKDNTMMPDGVTPVRYTASSLNLLVAPAYAWYWQMSRDDNYLLMGDALWTAGVMGAGKSCPSSKNSQDYTYQGKQFSQQYKWGCDYLVWRGVPQSRTAKINNPASPTGAPAATVFPPGMGAQEEDQADQGRCA
jgi:hypothetical protein